MEPTSANSLATEVQLEIERDMRVYHQPQKDGQSSLQEYVESIVARSPLLGMTVLDENKRKDIAYTAWRAIVRLAVGKKVQSWAHLSIFLTIIQYARGWERISDAGFWAYIANQFGFRYTQQLYNVLTNSVKAACQCYSRLFVVTPNGYNSYYSTVLAHAFAPNKSVFALFDFLVKFYRDNLDNSVYENDPAIGRMVSVLRDRCNGASIEQDEDIRGSVYGIQIGIKALLSNRPGYMRHFLTKTLQKIGSLLDGDELSGKDYVDVLLTQWLIGKMTVSSVPVVSTSKNRRSTPVHKRSTEIVFTYDRIRMEYILNDSNEPALRIPSIRLASRENPVLIISSNGMNVYQRTIGIYGNDYAATSEEEIIPLSDMDISSANLTNLNIELKIGEKTVFTSGNSLNAKALLFKDSKQLTGKTIDEGNFTLFAPNQVNISFQGNVEDRARKLGVN